jgi:hypothetical protein
MNLFLIFLDQNFAQLLEENFDYTSGTNLSSNGWNISSGAGTNPITIEPTSLTYFGYPSSGIGGSVVVDNNGEDVYKSFTTQSSGTIYTSLLVNVTNATTSADGDYFYSLGSSSAGTCAGRLFLRKSGSYFAFGISKGTGTPSFTNYDYSFSTTYLVVIKYVINSGSANDDVALFILTGSIPSSEPAATITHPTESSNDPGDISCVAFRQAITTNVVAVDGIRVATSWSTAPLPVELTYFNASLKNNSVILNWCTATEINNYGFQVESKKEKVESKKEKVESGWQTIGFVHGHGNSNLPNEYSFIDKTPFVGKSYYRLKQIDFDGTFKYSDELEVFVDAPQNFILFQNYPNPFNPETYFEYQLPFPGFVILKIYDAIGNEVEIILNEYKPAGLHKYSFNMNNRQKFSSGIYFYEMVFGKFRDVKKFVLLK